MKTIKQMADALGVDKQKVYRCIKKNHINEALHDAGVMWYDDTAESLIIRHFLESRHINEALHEAHQTASLDVVISMLKTELDIKNEQIRELNARLAESNAALVAAQQTAQAAQSLHAGTIQQQLLSEAPDETDAAPPSPTVGFFKRMFRSDH